MENKIRVGAANSPNRQQLLLKLLLVVSLTLLAYTPALRSGYIWDDDRYLTNNPLITAPDGLCRIWFSLDSPSQYFPLTYTTFRIEHALWGLNPLPYHFVNLLLHITNAILLWRLLNLLKIPGAWLAAGIFALHPVQVESVAWITERKNLLMGFFFLLTLIAWVAFINAELRQRWRFYVMALVFCALALFSKATACTLPVALLLILWLEKKPINRQRLIQIVPFVLLGLLMGLVTTWWEHYHQRTQGAEFAIGPIKRLLIATHALWFYAGKLVWPAKLTFSYPRWNLVPDDPLAYVWLVGLIGVAAVIYFARRYTGRGPEVAAIFFAGTLSPLLGFIMLYTFRYTFVADHYQYIACIGLIALFASAVSMAASKLQSRWRLDVATTALLLVVLARLTWHQAMIYPNAETLWTDTIAKNPASWLAHNNLGAELLRKGELNEAMKHFEMSLAIKPDHAEAENNLGNVFLRKGDTDVAIAHYRKALEIKPDHAPAFVNLGNAFARRGDWNESIVDYQRAIELKPDLAEAQNNLGFAYQEEGNLEAAVRCYEKAIALKPDYAEAHFNLAEALRELGRRDEAVAHLKTALRIKPDYSDAKRELRALGESNFQ